MSEFAVRFFIALFVIGVIVLGFAYLLSSALAITSRGPF